MAPLLEGRPLVRKVAHEGVLDAAEVEAVKARLAGAGRKAVQEALMPYSTLLPERFRRPNERIDEPLAAPAAPSQQVSPA